MTNPPEDSNSINNVPVISKSPGMAGLQWIAQSISIFSRNPSIWIVMLIIYVGLSILLTTIPLLVLLPTLLAPVFNAGFIYGAKAVDDGQMLEIDHLFAGFKQQLRGLFRLGMLYFFINLMIIAVVSIVLEYLADESSIAAMSQATTTMELEQLLINSPDLLSALLKALMFGFILSIPLIMASWFAPALVMLHQISAVQAMSLSIKACNRNILAFLFYGVLMIPLLLVSILPFGLGLLIMLPVIFIGQYCSYKMIFSQKQSEQGVFLV